MAENFLAKSGDGGSLMLGSTSLTSVVTNEATSNYTAIAQVLTFNPVMTCGEYRVDHMGSQGREQYIPGKLGATIQTTLNLVPYDATHADGAVAETVLSTIEARESRNWIFRIPCEQTNTSGATTYDVAVRGFLTNLSWNVDHDAANTADATIRVIDSDLVGQ